MLSPPTLRLLLQLVLGLRTAVPFLPSEPTLVWWRAHVACSWSTTGCLWGRGLGMVRARSD